MISEIAWAKMSRQQRKVALCKDVIASIQNSTLHVDDGNYIRVRSRDYDFNDLLPMLGCKLSKQQSKVLQERCKVCAIGSLFIRYLVNLDNFTLPEYSISEYADDITIDDDDMIKHLNDCFTPEELRFIEAAFEMTNSHYKLHFNRYLLLEEEDNFLDACMKFGADFEDPADRLLAIMQNIVDHKGEFKPKVRYEISVV